MATETQIYANKGLATAAKARSAQRHIDGWRPLHTDFNSDGTVTITWNNDPPPPETPEEAELRILREELQAETITPIRLRRLLKLVGV